MKQVKFVKSIEERQGGKSGHYWVVKWEDDKYDNIFDSKMRDVLAEAEKAHLAVAVEKQKGEKYWNITSVSLVKDELPPPQQPGPVEEIGGHKPPEPSRSQEIGEHVAFKSISDLIAKGIIKPEGITKPYWIWYWLKLSQLTGTKVEKPAERVRKEQPPGLSPETAKLKSSPIKDEPSAIPPDEVEQGAEPEEDTWEKLAVDIAERMNWANTKAVKSWIINKCKIPEDKLDYIPAVRDEVWALQGWTK